MKKILIMAHRPPPLHGQSYMVGLLADHLKEVLEDGQVHHVNMQVSEDQADIGGARWGKLLLLVKYCKEALSIRWKHGVTVLYYVPAPAKRAALLRDWVVMAALRPFFRQIVFHWHSVGLGQWLEREAGFFLRVPSVVLMGRHHTSIVLSELNGIDVAIFRPRRLAVVSNGIPDPLAKNASIALLQERHRRLAERKCSPATFTIIYLGLCSADKGLFDFIDACAMLLSEAEGKTRYRIFLGGPFPDEATREEFQERVARPEFQDALDCEIEYFGVVTGLEKERLYAEADCFCFPTYYANEGQPLTLLESMAYGLPIVTTRWRGIPEALPAGYQYLVEPRDVLQICQALRRIRDFSDFEGLRAHFEQNYLEGVHLEKMRTVLLEN